VDFIVRAVDYLLRHRFGLPDGLADHSTTTYKRPDPNASEGEIEEESHRVLVLDPAAGTGTFLYFVINAIHEFIASRQQIGSWPSYVQQHLIPRLFGLELMMAPYVIAHLKLGALLDELKSPLRSDQRMNVYLTNTLEPPIAGSSQAVAFHHFLNQEAQGAEEARSRLPIMVVLGNPPYSGLSANMGEQSQKLIDQYRMVDGKPLGERKLWLQDDYVKFIAFAQQRIEQTGQGIVAFISNHSYLDSPTFRGMRQSLLKSFDEIYIINLHGNARRQERTPDGSPDQNVFDIQQGVAIAAFVRLPESEGGVADVHYTDVWGIEDDKRNWLDTNSLDTVQWEKTQPSTPWYFMPPFDNTLQAEYETGYKVTEMLPVSSAGIITARDKVVFDFENPSLVARMGEFADTTLSDESIREKYFGKKSGSKYPPGDTRGWKLPEARRRLHAEPDLGTNIKPCLYRPFDARRIYYTDYMVDWPRRQVMRHMLAGENIALLWTRPLNPSYEFSITTTTLIVDQCAIGNKSAGGGISYLGPLYLYPDGLEAHAGVGKREPNLAPEFIKHVESQLGLTFQGDRERGDLSSTFGPRDIFDYIYAVFHSPTYRERYEEFLRIDFPRVPVTSNIGLFKDLVRLGGELVGIHLPDSTLFNALTLTTGFPVLGSGTVEKVRYAEPSGKRPGRVYINKTQYFEGVPPEVWEFQIGGYQVARKWLQDRRGRKLEYADTQYYQRVLAALARTRELMADIDQTIDGAGGWPIA